MAFIQRAGDPVRPVTTQLSEMSNRKCDHQPAQDIAIATLARLHLLRYSLVAWLNDSRAAEFLQHAKGLPGR